jgi:hypothetical protein
MKCGPERSDQYIYKDTLLSIGSNKLKIVIAEQSKEIVIRLEPSTLRTGIDSLDKKLQAGFMREVVFEGTIALDKIWETDERARSFEVEGDLTINEVKQPISMSGSIQESQQGMAINGLLYLHFDPELSAFGLNETLPEFAEFGCVEILQPISISNSRH